MRTFLLILKKGIFCRCCGRRALARNGWRGVMTVEGITYRRRAKASTVGSESSGRRLSPPFAAICRLIGGGRVVKRPGFLLVPGRGCDRFPALVDIKSEIAKRRTFAIISHPDAGKTTL